MKKIALIALALILISPALAQKEEIKTITASQPWIFLEEKCIPETCNLNDYCTAYGSWSCHDDCKRIRSKTCYDYCCNPACVLCDTTIQYQYSNCAIETVCSGGTCSSGTCDEGTDCTNICTRRPWFKKCNGVGSCSIEGGTNYYCSGNQHCSGGSCVSGNCGTCKQCEGLGDCNNVASGTDPYGDCSTWECQTGDCSGGSCSVYSDGRKDSCGTCEYCNDGDSPCDSIPNGQDPFGECSSSSYQSCTPSGEISACGWQQASGDCNGGGACGWGSCNDCGPHEASTSSCYSDLAHCNSACLDGFECDEHADCSDDCGVTHTEDLSIYHCSDNCDCYKLDTLSCSPRGEYSPCDQASCNGATYNCTVSNEGEWAWRLSVQAPEAETNCTDGYDNDCNGLSDSQENICQPPEWQNQGQNASSVLIGGQLLLYAQGRDSIALNESWLSTNESGSWQNYSTWGNCSGTPTNCTNYTDTTNCTGAGCSWDSADCYGTCTGCSKFSNSEDCAKQGGCSWEETSSCAGTVTACSSLSDSTSCNNQYGCSWTPGSCSGSCFCGLIPSCECDAIGCEIMIKMGPPPEEKCIGLCTCAIANDQACCEDHSCTWTAGSCSGTATTCPNIDNATGCGTQEDCSWNVTCESGDVDIEQTANDVGYNLALYSYTAQTFKTNGAIRVDQVDVNINCGKCSGTVYMAITNTDVFGNPSTTVYGNTTVTGINGTPQWVSADYTSDIPELAASTTYALVILKPTTSLDYLWYYNSSSSTYTNGSAKYYNSGWYNINGDFTFKIYGNCSGSNGECNGTCTNCTTYGTSSHCSNQDGCTWDNEDCSGTPSNCNTHNSTVCDKYGCSIAPGEHGSPMNMNETVNTWTWSNFTWQNVSVEFNNSVCWKIWYWDTHELVNGTNTLCFNVTQNTAPTVMQVEISPEYPTDDQALTCNWKTADNETATIYANVTWRKNGGIWATYNQLECYNASSCSTNATTGPGSANTTLGDEWNCSVTVYDVQSLNMTGSDNTTIMRDVTVIFTDGQWETFAWEDIKPQLWTNSTNQLANFTSTCTETGSSGVTRYTPYWTIELTTTDKIVKQIKFGDTTNADSYQLTAITVEKVEGSTP